MIERCSFCERDIFLCVCGEKVLPFQTSAKKATQPESPPKRRGLHPSDVAHIRFTSAVDSGDYWIDDPNDIVKLFAFLKVNKIKINFGDPDL